MTDLDKLARGLTEAEEREIYLMAELSGLDQMNIILANLVRRAMRLIPEGKSLWWDEADAALEMLDRAVALRAEGASR